MPLIRQVARRALCALLPPRMWLARGPSGESGVALTFDDGPDPKHTPRVLDELARQDVRGTFFVIGQKAAKHNSESRYMVKRQRKKPAVLGFKRKAAIGAKGIKIMIFKPVDNAFGFPGACRCQ